MTTLDIVLLHSFAFAAGCVFGFARQWKRGSK